MKRLKTFGLWQPPLERLARARILAFFVLICSCGTQERAISVSRASIPTSPQWAEELDYRFSPERVRNVTHEIALLRGWKEELVLPLELSTISRIREALAADMHDQMPPPILRDQSRLLESFGLMRHGFNLENAVLNSFAPEIVGFYSLTWQKILIARDGPSSRVESTLRHELVHAFQDRLFKLRERVRWGPNRGDEIAAIHALSEGEAVCVAQQLDDPKHRGCFDEVLAEEPLIDDGESSDLPPVIRYGLFAPYSDGVRFVRSLLRHGGWSRVDQAWSEGIHTTRELFGKATGGKEIDELLPVNAPAPQCRSTYVDVMGQQGLASVLFRGDNENAARLSAAALVSDRIAYWSCPSSCVSVWHLRATNQELAQSLLGELRRALGMTAAASKPAPNYLAMEGRTLHMARHQRDIEITSVHDCGDSRPNLATLTCPFLSDSAR